MQNKTKVRLSASRIKTLFNCGILYHAQYIKKVPQGKNNSGAARGSSCHYVLECLLRPDRKERVEKILKLGDPWVDAAVKRMAKHHATKLDVGDDENFEMIRKFILVALQTDFYCEGAKEVIAEQQFNIETDAYHINGFIDKKSIYDDKVKIIDYKSSKAKFTGKEVTFNLQNYFYTLATKKEHPELPVELEFHFLKFAKDPVQKAPRISDEELVGFEEWLGEVTKFVETLSIEEAKMLAAKGSYDRGWLCGKMPGDINKAGLPAFVCQFKMPFIYFELLEKGVVMKSSRDKTELETILKSGQEIQQRSWNGCSAWSHLWKK
jgi:hypothetical protein